MNLKDLVKPQKETSITVIEDAEFEEESDLYEALRLLDDCRDIFDQVVKANRIRLGGYLLERLMRLDVEVQTFLDQWDNEHMGGGEI